MSFRESLFAKKKGIELTANLNPDLSTDSGHIVFIVSGFDTKPDEFFAIQKYEILKDYE